MTARGSAVLGFVLVLVVAAAPLALYLGGVRPAGWAGGEFAMAAGWAAVGALVLGGLLSAVGRGAVQGLGRGMLLGALACGILGVVAIILFFVAFAHSGLTF